MLRKKAYNSDIQFFFFKADNMDLRELLPSTCSKQMKFLFILINCHI